MTMELVPGKLDKDILSNRSREELESLILMLQGEVHDLRKQNLGKDMEIANLREINRMRLLEKYMPSSEQMASLFDELELYDLAQPVLEDEGRITVSAHEKRGSRPGSPPCRLPRLSTMCIIRKVPLKAIRMMMALSTGA